MKFASRLVQFDAAPGDRFRPTATPIYQTATFEQEHADQFGDYDYSRSGNPTRTVLEEQVARLEGGTRGFAFASGMAAITAVARTLRTGDEILADIDLYGGTCRLFTRILERSGITANYADAGNLESFAAKITPRTRLLFVESPTNPLLRVLDLRALAALAHENNALLVVDNSLMSPYLQNPLALGADIVVHSATKFLSGHADVMGGVVVVARCKPRRRHLPDAERRGQRAGSVRLLSAAARPEDAETAHRRSAAQCTGRSRISRRRRARRARLLPWSQQRCRIRAATAAGLGRRLGALLYGALGPGGALGGRAGQDVSDLGKLRKHAFHNQPARMHVARQRSSRRSPPHARFRPSW